MKSRLLNTPDFYIFDERKPARMQNTYRNKMMIGGIDKRKSRNCGAAILF